MVEAVVLVITLLGELAIHHQLLLLKVITAAQGKMTLPHEVVEVVVQVRRANLGQLLVMVGLARLPQLPERQ